MDFPNPQRWNRYTYGLNNPLKYVDPDGKDADCLHSLFASGIRDVNTSDRCSERSEGSYKKPE